MAHLDERLATLRNRRRFAPELLARFRTFIETASDDALYRINAVAFAKVIGAAENETIDLLVHAANVGLFEMTWGKVCELCGAYLVSDNGIRDAGDDMPCAPCEFRVTGALEDTVEVTFTLSPSVRRLRFEDLNAQTPEEWIRTFVAPSAVGSQEFYDYLKKYWIAPPTVEPGQRATVVLEHPASGYVAFTGASHAASKIWLKKGAPRDGHVDFFDGRIVPGELTLSDRAPRLTVHNRTPRRVTMWLERIPGDDDLNGPDPLVARVPCLTGKRLLASQSFRDLFPGQTLGKHMLHIKNMSFIFTDLRGSTALYAKVGDLKAHRMVQDHFEVLGEVVDRQGGAIVKTIGDAVMATFAEPEAALSAALKMNAALATLRRRDLALKVGVHAGECLAIDSNDRLDFFGQTVNIAARVQALAAGGEVVCTDAIWTDPAAARLAKRAKLRPRSELVRLKGVEGRVRVVRLKRASA